MVKRTSFLNYGNVSTLGSRSSRLQSTMFGLGPLSKTQRLLLGMLILLLVDVIWVASSELTQQLYPSWQYDKPYFITYLKTSMFIVYLSGFLCYKAWTSYKCTHSHSVCEKNDDTESALSEPIFVPVRFDVPSTPTHVPKANSVSCKTTGSKQASLRATPRVRFSTLSEVRHLPVSVAVEAARARLSWEVSTELGATARRTKLTVKQVAKAAGLLCLIYFFGTLSWEQAGRSGESPDPVTVGVAVSPGGLTVDCLASTTALFTLILAAIFPSSSGDRFTLSKFVAVLLSIGGAVLVSAMAGSSRGSSPPVLTRSAVLWTLSGSLLYAVYLVVIRRRAENEDKLNMPMFLGFVGLFTIVLLWPGFLVVHFYRLEQFEWPDRWQWAVLVLHGLIGTVISDLLWLWGCFLTTSLIATLSLTLTIPMSLLLQIARHNVVGYHWLLYLGMAPVFLAWFAVSALCHYDNWDPVALGARKLTQCVWRRGRAKVVPRLRTLDREQCESLISVTTHEINS